jgi:hypothetical protein
MADKSSQRKHLKEAAPEDLIELPPELMERLFPPAETNAKDISSMALEDLKNLTPWEFVDYFQSGHVAPEHEELGDLTIEDIAAMGEQTQEGEDEVSDAGINNTININIHVHSLNPGSST